MHLEDFVSRLERVQRTRTGSYIASCPAHQDRSPSLAVRETEDGRILLKCFAGCAADEVVGSMGLTLGDLFPEKLTSEHTPSSRRPFPLSDVLRALVLETDLIVLYSAKLRRGERFTDADRSRLLLAAQRINSAVMEVGL